jgi:hypothetical protein
MKRFLIALGIIALGLLTDQGGRAILVCRLGVCTPAAVQAGVQVPGPSLALFNNQTYYSCTSNRYVSTTGSSGNNGTSAGTPWDIPTAEAYAAPAGTCINLATGVYDVGSAAINGMAISHGGTSSSKTGYVVWRCSSMPFSFSGGVLQGEGSGCVLKDVTTSIAYPVTVAAPYLMFDGIEVDGNSNNATFVCIDNEGAGNGTQNPNHHIWFINSDAHHCGLAGLQWNNTDWLFAIHSVWHDNSSTNGILASGVSFYDPVGLTGYSPTPGNPDYWVSATTGKTYRVIVAYNVGYHNYNPQSGTGNTDGEGFIMDDWGHAQNACPGTGTCPYDGNALVMGNIFYGNGGAGIEAFSWADTTTCTCGAAIVNNTTYADTWDTHQTATFRGSNYSDEGINLLVINNISYAIVGAGILSNNTAFLGQGNSIASGNLWQNNIGFPAGQSFQGANGNTFPTGGPPHGNLDGSDPKFVSIAGTMPTVASNPAGNFALQGTSPAIGFGQAFDLWQQSGSVDAGACVSSLTTCP